MAAMLSMLVMQVCRCRDVVAWAVPVTSALFCGELNDHLAIAPRTKRAARISQSSDWVFRILEFPDLTHGVSDPEKYVG